MEFKDTYEKYCQNYAIDFPDDLQKLLIEKRDFGLKKYGEISFQSSYENAMGTDTVQHAKEEVIDLINYLIHETYKNSVNKDPIKFKKIKKLLKKSIKIYNKLKEL